MFCSFNLLQLSRKVVQNIHLSGGSLLGVSRGGPSVSEIVDSMEVCHLVSKSLRNLSEITEFLNSEILNLLRREESTCFLCLVETGLMLARTLYTMRFLLETKCCSFAFLLLS